MQRLRYLPRLVGLSAVAGVLLALIVTPAAVGLGLLSNQVRDSVADISPDLVTGPLPSVTTMTDKDGAPIAYLYDQYRVPAATSAISAAMKAAVVAIEDRRFYQHGAVDWQGALRALVNNEAGGDRQGASTLTEQYVKNYELYVAAKTDTQRREATEPTIARKLREARIAVQLERQLSKDEILTRYLNIVYLGNNAYGVGAAAHQYFDTTPDQLTVAQAALLAGMVQSPTNYDPLHHPQDALARRNMVIRQMQQQGMITEAQQTTALAAPLGVADRPTAPPNGCIAAADAAFFCEYVIDYLRQAGITPEQLNTGGYTIRTTLDRSVLAKVKAAVDAEVPPKTPHVADVMSVVAPGPDKHRVLAMAANRTYGVDPSQLETSFGLPYQPENFGAGSVYKIFTAATAMEQNGLGIDSIIDVPPSGYTSPIYKNGSGKSIPVRNDGSYADRMTLQDALAFSPNTAFVKLEETTGVPPVVDMAVRLGLKSLASTPATSQPGSESIADQVKSQKQASFTLGVTPTSDVELANVDATLASHGVWCPPSPIEQIIDSTGKPVAVREQACTQAIAPQIADTLLTGMSKDDQGGGTSAAAAGSVGWDRPVAAKTGTTQEYKSAAFVGVTPQLAGAVIVFDDSSAPRPICDGAPPYSCGYGNIYGGKVPARTFYGAMTAILAGQPPLPLPPVDPRYVGGAKG